MQDNTGEMQTQITEHDSALIEKITDAYSLYGTNQADLLTSIHDSNTEASEKVTNGLADAKERLTVNTAANHELLSPITAKLSYTKSGNIGNDSVYRYIVSPLTVTKDSANSQVKNNNQNDLEKVETASADTNERKRSGNNLLVTLLGIVIALLLLGVIVYAVTNKRKEY